MYHGDIRLGDTIDIKFTTRAFATGVPTVLTGSPTIAAYPSNSTTEITAGITLTASLDSVVGMNNVRIVATSGNGYVTATNYTLVITAGTVGGTSVVGECVGSFSIEARSALMPTTAARTLVVDAAGLADANTVKLGPTGSGTAQTAKDVGGAVPAVAAGASGGLLISGANSGTTTLAALTITGVTTYTGNVVLSDGLTISAPSTANRAGFTITGNGTGAGVSVTSGNGATGNGLDLIANSTNGEGFSILGKGTGRGILSTGGSTGEGVKIISGNGATGAGLTIIANSTNGNGITCNGSGTGHGVNIKSGTGATGNGVYIQAQSTNGIGLRADGIGTQPGFSGVGGATSGSGMELDGQGTGSGLLLIANGAGGHGLSATGNGTGHGGVFNSGSGATGDGLHAEAKSTNGNGMIGVKTGTGKAIKGPVDLVDTLTTYTGDTPQTGDNYARLGAPAGASVSADIAAIRTNTNIDIPGLIAGLNNISAAAVNAEVVDCLNVDTYAQPGQATPAATTTITLMLRYLYKAWRNKTTATASQYNLFNDDAVTVDQKAALSDDATTYTRGEIATGP